MILTNTKDYGFIQRIDVIKNGPGHQFSSLIDHNLAIIIGRFIYVLIHLTFKNFIITGKDKLIQIGSDALYPVGGEESVIYTVFQ
jgi:hypothetical protein